MATMIVVVISAAAAIEAILVMALVAARTNKMIFVFIFIFCCSHYGTSKQNAHNKTFMNNPPPNEKRKKLHKNVKYQFDQHRNENLKTNYCMRIFLDERVLIFTSIFSALICTYLYKKNYCVKDIGRK